MSAIRVLPAGGSTFEVVVRGHNVVVDQPADQGGADLGPTPTELFVAGLAACVAHYASGYLRRHSIDPAGFAVSAAFAFAEDRPSRVSRIDVTVQPPPALPTESTEAFLAVASHCTVHNTLTRGVDILVALASTRSSAEPSGTGTLVP